MSTIQELLLPRPGAEIPSPVDTILGPSEELFTKTFGHHLSQAKYISTAYGKIAYYTYSPIRPSQATTPERSTTPSRVLLLHGVQTPALGLQPLASSLHTSFPTAEFVLVDLWGHGLSFTPIVPHSPSLFHYLIDSVLETLNWGSCHLVGYSFGGSTAISYIASSALRAQKVTSVSLVAPAGLWKTEDLDEEKLQSEDFDVVKTHVLELLEGGPLVMPDDWEAKIARGEIVAEKVRDWQMQYHPGHTASVIAIVRDGGVMGQEEVFRAAAKMKIPVIAVLGETDDVVYERDLKAVGIENVVVVEGVGHGVVRQEVGQVAKIIEGFWKGL
jgi:pimeloyl-ACP methyl ester carboxylesterase